MSIESDIRYDPDTGLFWWLKPKRGRKLSRPAGSLDGSKEYGYVRICYDGESFLAHRLAWRLVHGSEPDGEIDHINGDRSDNRISNLRVATRSEQMRNMRVGSNSTTGHRGVSRNQKTGRYSAQIGVKGKTRHIGSFEHIEAAVCARKRAERQHGYHENHGRAQ